MTLTTWHELTMAQGRAPLEIIDAIIFNAQAVAVAAAGFAAIVEAGGYIVFLAAHIVQKEQEKALAKGREEAYEDVDKQLDAYFERMDKARAAGEEFNEPRPRFRRNGR